MTKQELSLMKGMIEKSVNEVIPPAIEKTVNGKIRGVSESLESFRLQYAADKKVEADFRESMQPFMQAKIGGTFVFKGLVGIGSLAMAWIAIKQLFPLL